MLVSAKTGENIVKAFYKIAAETIGIKLSASELGFYDSVVTANIAKLSGDDESRTDYADAIEREDMEAERRRIEAGEGNPLCKCTIA